MAMVMENQQPVVQMQLTIPAPPPAPQVYKHHCKVCKKGFMCGRALGGHMRAHGIADDGLSAGDTLDDDDLAPAAHGEPSENGSPSTAAKRMYGLRANPGRPRNCRVCENCGKEFTSWKSLLDHGRCTIDGDEDEDLDDGGEEEEDDEELALAAGWSKGKRSRRAKVMMVGSGEAPSSEEEDLANCLVMLSSSHVSQPPVDADQESCASASKQDEERNRVLLPQPISVMAPAAAQHLPTTVRRGMFECKACKKVFTSHQALGGHRASHKKVKGCFAAKFDNSHRSHQPVTAAAAPSTTAITEFIPTTSVDSKTSDANANDDGVTTNVHSRTTVTPETAIVPAVDDAAPSPSVVSPFKKKGKVHECSICHRVFTSGQALGGHKRCHWITSGTTDPASCTVAKLQPVVPDHLMSAMCHQLTLGRAMFDAADQRALDLNVPTNASAEAAAAAGKGAVVLNDSTLCLNAPASMYMQSWTGHSNASYLNKTTTSSRNNTAGGGAATEDEADSTSAKRAKIGDLRDMKVAGEALPWLQVGIGIGVSSSESKEKGTHE